MCGATPGRPHHVFFLTGASEEQIPSQYVRLIGRLLLESQTLLPPETLSCLIQDMVDGGRNVNRVGVVLTVEDGVPAAPELEFDVDLAVYPAVSRRHRPARSPDRRQVSVLTGWSLS